MMDPEFNEGNKYFAIKGAIEEAQMMMQPSYVFPVRIIVNKKLTKFFQDKPYEFTFEFNNTGLDSKHDGIIKVILI